MTTLISVINICYTTYIKYRPKLFIYFCVQTTKLACCFILYAYHGYQYLFWMTCRQRRSYFPLTREERVKFPPLLNFFCRRKNLPASPTNFIKDLAHYKSKISQIFFKLIILCKMLWKNGQLYIKCSRVIQTMLKMTCF